MAAEHLLAVAGPGKLGADPVRMLFERVAGPTGADGAPGVPVTVRVIEYAVHTTAQDGGEQTSEVFCLVTSLLDMEEYPALDLACKVAGQPSFSRTRFSGFQR